MGKVARYAARRDIAEKPIISVLRGIGALVYQLDLPCDLAVLFRGRWFLMEVKTLLNTPKDRQRAQKEFLAITGTPIVRTPQEALKAIGAVQ